MRVDEADLWVRADAQRLRQVLINLVGNAIKFTQSGGWVEISVRVDRITVTDSGPGIGSDDLSKLFMPFHRLGEHPSEGSGLGLALSNQLVNAMSGRIEVDSRIGRGTSFSVFLPCAEQRVLVRRKHRTAFEPPINYNGTILSVEDDPGCARLIESSLTGMTSLTVISAQNLASAWEVLADRDQLIDLVLLDVQLPDGNGWELVRRIRTEFRGRDLPVVVLSAASSGIPEDMGGIPFLPKPIVIADLMRALDDALGSATR